MSDASRLMLSAVDAGAFCLTVGGLALVGSWCIRPCAIGGPPQSRLSSVFCRRVSAGPWSFS